MGQRRGRSWTRSRRALRTQGGPDADRVCSWSALDEERRVTRAQDSATPRPSRRDGVPTSGVSGHGQVNSHPTRPPSPSALT